MIIALNEKTPTIEATAFVAPNATIIGDVHIGAHASVWFGAVIRGDIGSIQIGHHTNVQDLCVLHVEREHALTIGDEVTVGHRAILHGCTIGDGALIGMGATIMNGAIIGAQSVIGAGAVVTEGMNVPPRSLVLGVPAKIKGELEPSTTAKLAESAQRYAQFAQTYIDAGIMES